MHKFIKKKTNKSAPAFQRGQSFVSGPLSLLWSLFWPWIWNGGGSEATLMHSEQQVLWLEEKFASQEMLFLQRWAPTLQRGPGGGFVLLGQQLDLNMLMVKRKFLIMHRTQHTQSTNTGTCSEGDTFRVLVSILRVLGGPWVFAWTPLAEKLHLSLLPLGNWGPEFIEAHLHL